MKTRKWFKGVCAALAVVLLLPALCIPAFAAGENSIFTLTAKVDSTKIVKDGAAYDMYTYTGGQAALQQDTDGTLWIPIRIVSEMAGLTVVWNGQEDSITLTDPVTGDYWIIGIDWDFAAKYNAAGEMLTQHWMYKIAALRGGAAYITIQDIAALYGFQIYDREYNGDTYAVITNQPLTLAYSQITALCAAASALL